MFRSIVLLATLALAFGGSLKEEFESFKLEHGKTYVHPKEEAYRYQVFAKNLKKIEEHNKRADQGLETYRMGVNAFTDMEFSEFSAKYLGLKIDESVSAPLIHNRNSTSALPKSVDWRKKGIVNEIKDQGQCGGCWAFSTTASVEGAWAQASKSLVSLSEQNLIDCSESEGNQGCNGGLMDYGFSYIIKNKGLDTEASYPFTAKTGSCLYKSADKGATISKYVDIPTRDESALQNAVAERVVSVAIHADSGLQHYKSGVFSERFCPGYATFLNHGVAVVGYNIEDSTSYWIVRNSWGKSWGEEGYARFAYGRNLCGISTKASYPIV